MDEQPRPTSKGQVTIPKRRAVVAKTRDFLELAGSVAVPVGKRATAWDDVIRRTRVERAKSRH